MNPNSYSMFMRSSLATPRAAAGHALARPELLGPGTRRPEAKQRRSRDKRERLKRAARELFAERGYEGTAVGDIARRARLAVGTFYQHFDSKRELLLVLMDELLEQVGKVKLHPAASTDVRGALHAMLGEASAGDRQVLGVYRA
jgi:AcrR family transcriptional regulator